MTEITLKDECNCCDISIKGHAGYAESGSDIVCAGISAITMALVAEMYLQQDKNHIRNYEHDEELGSVHLSFDYIDYCAREALETAMVGYELLSKNYPDYIKIKKI